MRFVNQWETISLRSLGLVREHLETYVRTEIMVYFARFAQDIFPDEARYVHRESKNKLTIVVYASSCWSNVLSRQKL